MQETLGDVLHRRRKELKLTLQQLADKSGVSRAAISKIERAESGASTPVLGKLAEALELSISQLIGGTDRTSVQCIPAAQQPVFREDISGFERQSLSPLYLGRGIDFVLNRLPPRAKTGPFPSHRPGVEEHLYVTKGRLKVTLEDEEFILETGDFLFYQADRSHLFENLTGRVCEYFIVIDSTRLR
ncbi:MAG: helix-turn-helix transcriptional regulator [Alphaproteobacteria bacterium]|jgi:transcriptional regulator with XRE-family HTH domain|nr:helix-turn-helix transcriptional regulator [Alphaproteobacteria bacterium]